MPDELITPPAAPKKQRRINSRQLIFVHLVAGGMQKMKAYLEAFGRVVENGYAPVLARKPNVSAEIQRLQSEAEAASHIQRDEALRFLAEIIRTPVGDLHHKHPLVQDVIVTRRGEVETVRVRGISKLDALKLLAQICGWLRPGEKEEEPLTVILKKMW